MDELMKTDLKRTISAYAKNIAKASFYAASADLGKEYENALMLAEQFKKDINDSIDKL
jgi:hypothetical protein